MEMSLSFCEAEALMASHQHQLYILFLDLMLSLSLGQRLPCFCSFSSPHSFDENAYRLFYSQLRTTFPCSIMPLLIFLLVFCFLSPAAANFTTTPECRRVCGGTRVCYPFGFSDGCEIRLNCSANGEIRIGEFWVQNVTGQQILVSLPAKCNRPIMDMASLFGDNFAPTWRNALLFENCIQPLHDCSIPTLLLKSKIRSSDCVHNVSCYSVGTADDFTLFMDFERVRRKANCTIFVSAITVDPDLKQNGTAGSRSSISLDFQFVDLGWWVRGECACDPNASCTLAHNSPPGFRCNCNDGFAGDGFSKGQGCQRVFTSAPDSGSQDQSHRRFSGHRRKIKLDPLAVGIVFGALLMAAITTIVYCMKKRSATLKSRLSARRLINEVAGESTVPLYLYKDIERASNGFSESRRIGTGAYGTVYVGKLHNNQWLAIKRLKHRDKDCSEQVKNEIKLLSSVSHPNLVRLLGCCIENGEHILVYEYMPNGTLAQHLNREKGSILPWTTRLTIATETAHAIAYLHSSVNPPIFHRDIKSSNILLDYNFNSKLADFGLSRYVMTDDSHVSTAPQGTPGYVDPQYHQNYHLSDKSDVYSFGVVLVEIITAMKAVDFNRPHGDVNLAVLAVERIGNGCIDEIIDPFIDPNSDAWTLSSVHRVGELAFRCLSFHRDMRPSMMEVAEELEQIKLSGWMPFGDSVRMASSGFSSCSSLLHESDESSFRKSSSRKVAAYDSQRLAVPAVLTEENLEGSIVSVQDSWPSQRSSGSSCLLSNAVNTNKEKVFTRGL